MRFNSGDGSLDTTFDTDGIAQNNFSFFDVSTDVLLQPDGNIVVAGSRCCPGAWDILVSRFNADGTVDTAFGSDGNGSVVVSPSAGNDFGNGMALQTDGKIVVVGSASISSESGEIAVVRMNANGTLDTSFGSGGIVTADAVTGQSEAGRNVSIQSDGKIVVAGFANVSGTAKYLVFRLDGSGTLDSSFGTGGVATTDVSGGADEGFDLLILSNGKIAVAGGAAGHFRVVLYNTDGSLDSGFGTGGISEAADFNTSLDRAFGIALQTDGNLVVGGGSFPPFNFYIARYVGPPAAPPDSLEQVIEDCQEIVDDNPGSPLADKMEDVCAKAQAALDDTAKDPPDNQAAMGSIEGAVGDLEAAVKDGLLESSVGTDLMARLAAIAAQMAQDAMDEAIAQGGDPAAIADAQAALDDGDALRASGDFKDAVGKYKDAIALSVGG